MAWNDHTSDVDATMLAEFGEPIGYRGARGKAEEPVTATAILDRSALAQSSSPGYFGTIEVDEAEIGTPQKDDLVTWADGVDYRVTRIVRPEYGLTRLELCRASDPAELAE